MRTDSLPAREIERVVADAVAALLEDRGTLGRVVREAEIAAERVPELLKAVHGWRESPLDLVKRVELAEDEISIRVDLSRFAGEREAIVRHVVSARIRRRGIEMRLVVNSDQNAHTARKLDPALIKAVARARGWFDDLVSGRARSYDEIARREDVTRRYVGRLMPLAFLAPDIVSAIVRGTQPIDLTVETITKRTELPLDWAEQRSILRLDRHPP